VPPANLARYGRQRGPILKRRERKWTGVACTARSSSRRRITAIFLAIVPSLLFLDLSAPQRVDATTPLTVVRHLVASISGDEATITWQPPVGGRAVRYQVQALLNGADYGTRIVRSTSIVWDRMPFNQRVQFVVTPIGPDVAGYESGEPGPENSTGIVIAGNTYCPPSAGECLVVNGTPAAGAHSPLPTGLLHGTVPAGNKYARMLRLGTWRISADIPIEYAEATAYVAPDNLIEVLSDGWYDATAQCVGGRCFAADPWSNWNAYTTFIETTVKRAEAAGQNPYWEIQNEPEDYPYSPVQSPNRALVEQQYLYAYREIKAVDSTARVIGPSINWKYEDTAAGWWIDMKSFISFAAANGMKLAAIAWHDNSAQTDSNPPTYLESPESIRDHAAEVRELITENPGIGHPALFVDENSSAAGQFAPGWEAGYLAEENRAGIASADRTCWGYPGEPPGAGCFQPNLDQLLARNGQPLPSFWALADYTSMSGQQLWSESSDTNLSSFAARNSDGQIQILLGRHQTCSGWTAGRSACGVLQPPPAVPTSVFVLVPSEATSAEVAVEEIPDVSCSMPVSPSVTVTEVKVVDGVARMRLDIPDGAAYFLTVRPDSWLGGAPNSGNQVRSEVPAAAGPSSPARLIPEYGAQDGSILGSFSQPLVALATDQYGDPLTGRQVIFQLPPGYGIFEGTGGSRAVGTTNADGLATSPLIRAGARPGTFSALAQLAQGGRWGRPSAYFTLNTRV
jgi:hypothetical protein